jgi:hypothetical protein
MKTQNVHKAVQGKTHNTVFSVLKHGGGQKHNNSHDFTAILAQNEEDEIGL